MRTELEKDQYIIRTVKPADNEELKEIIITSLLEFGATGDGFACNDLETRAMFEAYQKQGRKYYVLVNAQNKAVVGGAGVAPLKGSTEICEFVKMYYLPEVRGLGLGSKMLELCINNARQMGYSQMYLETLEQMTAARGLYEKFGFKQIDAPMGSTGHYSCDVFYIKKL